MDKTIISVAVVGGGPTKEMNPAVTYTPKEIADAAIKCSAAGAAITHQPLLTSPDRQDRCSLNVTGNYTHATTVAKRIGD